MKRFLLLALTAGLLSPIAANAESVWLVLLGRSSDSMEKIQMQDMKQCEEMGKYWQQENHRKSAAKKWTCMKGK